MARIAGIDLPREKRIEIGLTYIYGIGRTSANKILAQAGISPDVRVKDLSEEDEAKLREIIGHDYTVEGDLRRNVAMDIKRLTEIGCYRASATARGCLSAASVPRRTPVPARVPSVPSPTRRSKEGYTWLQIPRVRKWCASAASVKTWRRARCISVPPSTTRW